MRLRDGWPLAAFFLLVVLPSQGAGQGVAADTLRLSLDAAVERALDRNEAVELAREAMTLAEAQIRGARAGAFPQVTGALNYDRTLRSVFDLGSSPPPDPDQGEEGGFDLADLFGDLPFGQPNTWIASFQVNQALYTGGRLSAGLDIAERARAATRHSLSDAEAQMTREVRQAYFMTVHAGLLVEIADEALALAEAHLAQVERFRDRGVASDFEVLQARVERDNREPGVVEARSARRLAELRLRSLLDLGPDVPLDLVSPLDAPEVEIDREAVLEGVLERPSLRAADEQVRIQEELIRVARAERRPTLSAAASFSFQAFPDRIFPSGVPGGSEWREDWSIGLRASIPIFDGFRASAGIEESRSGVRSAVLQREQLREGLVLEAESAWAEYEGARARIRARRATVEEAERALELVELRYENGLARLIEVSNARLLLEQARTNEADARLGWLNALAALEYAAGGRIRVFEP